MTFLVTERSAKYGDQKQLEYTWLRTLIHRYADFEEVNRDSLRYTLNHLKL